MSIRQETVATSEQTDDVQDRAGEWVVLQSQGSLKPEQQQAFARWLETSDAHREAYIKAERLWKMMRGLDSVAGHRLDDAGNYYLRHNRKSRVKALALAATVACVCVIAWYADPAGYFNRQEYMTAVGEQKLVQLDDGSQMELNTNTRAIVRYTDKAREIHLLQGQAVFTVAHDDAREFDVLAAEGRIRDIGTRFDVRLEPDNVAVAVLEGEVEVSTTVEADVTPLHQGQRLRYLASGKIVDSGTVNINTYSAWRQGKIVFDGQALEEVIRELNRYYAVDIRLTDTDIRKHQVSGIFPTNNLQQALYTIASALPVQLVQVGHQAWQIERAEK